MHLSLFAAVAITLAAAARGLTTPAANLAHMLTVPAYNLATLSACCPCLFTAPLVGHTLAVRRTAAFTGNFPLLLGVHGCKTAV